MNTDCIEIERYLNNRLYKHEDDMKMIRNKYKKRREKKIDMITPGMELKWTSCVKSNHSTRRAILEHIDTSTRDV